MTNTSLPHFAHSKIPKTIKPPFIKFIFSLRRNIDRLLRMLLCENSKPPTYTNEEYLHS
ncbi:MAG: hypothetical protein FWE23_06730 [Chitinivibrionia bacterium]|nr:hypothetical protein [Chitinivibrionia bacterium]